MTPTRVQSMHDLSKWLGIAHLSSGVSNAMLIILNGILSQ